MLILYLLCSLEKLLKRLRIGPFTAPIESHPGTPDEVHNVHKFTATQGDLVECHLLASHLRTAAFCQSGILMIVW